MLCVSPRQTQLDTVGSAAEVSPGRDLPVGGVGEVSSRRYSAGVTKNMGLGAVLFCTVRPMCPNLDMANLGHRGGMFSPAVVSSRREVMGGAPPIGGSRARPRGGEAVPGKLVQPF